MYKSGYELRSDPELTGRSVLGLDFSTLVFMPDRAVLAPLEVFASAATTGRFDLSLLTQEVRSGRLCFAVTEEAMLAQLTGTGPSYGPWNARMDSINSVLLGDFKVSRHIGSRLLLSSDSCLAAAHLRAGSTAPAR